MALRRAERSGRPKVLVADIVDGVKTITTILGDRVDILACHTLEDALLRMREGIDLVVCGLHFDESRMYGLLRVAKADRSTRGIPFVCFRENDSALPPSILQGLEIACSALGASAFVDLYQLKIDHGVKEADDHLRDILLALVR